MQRLRSIHKPHRVSHKKLKSKGGRLFLAAVAAVSVDAAAAHAAGPITVANVAAGAASFAHEGNTTVIHASDNTIINYRQFNIPAGQVVDFVQPSAASRVLNRVITAVPSQIDGTLRANGVVYLVNPAGVIFGPHSVVNVGDLYAAAGHLSSRDFLAGVDHFTDLSGAVINTGNINAGAVSLLGANVINTGVINAPDGTIVLASAHSVYLTRIGGLITAKLTDAADAGHLGAAHQSASSAVKQADQLVCAGSPLALGIMNSGTLQAQRITAEAAGKDSTAVITGTLNASTTETGMRGGTISIQAGHVAVGYSLAGAAPLSASPTTLTADGPSGGGTVLIGAVPDTSSPTGYQDAAQSDRVSGQTILDASATAIGSGGFIDTSGRELSIAAGAQIIGTGAGGGAAGTWQLDPASLVISSTQPSGSTAISSSGSNPLTFSQTGSTGSYWVNSSTIDTALAGTSHPNSGISVTVTAAGALSLQSAINPAIVSSNAETLTLEGGSIDLEQPIDPTGNSSTLSVALTSTAGAVTVNSDIGTSTNPVQQLQITAAGGPINIRGNVYTSGSVGQNYAGSINITGPSVTLSDTSTGNIILGTSGGTDTLTNATAGATLSINSAGGYIADNASMALNVQSLSLNWSAGGKSSGSDAVEFNAPVNTAGGYLSVTSSGSGSLKIAGQSAGSVTSSPFVNTDGGNATFTLSGGNLSITGGSGGSAAGGTALSTGTGNLSIVISSGSSGVTISGGSGGAASATVGGAGGYGAIVDGSVTIGSSGKPAGSIQILGGNGGAAANGIIGGAGGVGLEDTNGVITLNFSAASEILGGATGTGGGGSGGSALDTTASNLQFNPTSNAVFTFNNNSAGIPFTTTGSFTFSSGGTLALAQNLSTSGGITIQTPMQLQNRIQLSDSSSSGISLAGAAGTGQSLTAIENGTGPISLSGQFGSSSNPLGGFAADTNGGAVDLNAASLATSGGIHINGSVALSGSNSLADNSTAGISLADAITGNSSPLTISETGSSSINFGGNLSVHSLAVTGNSIFGPQAATFSTSAGMAFGNLTLGTATTLTDTGTTGSGISIGAVTGGSQSLTLAEDGTAGQSINIKGDITGVARLATSGPAILAATASSISTLGGQIYQNSLQMDGTSVSLSDTSATGISIASIVNSANAELAIDETGLGNITLPTSSALASLTVTAGGSTVFTGSGTITTTAGQAFNSGIVLAPGQNITLLDGSSTGISVSTLNGTPTSELAIDETGAGPVKLSGLVGAFSVVNLTLQPQSPSLGSLVVSNNVGPIDITTPFINVGTLSLSSGDNMAVPIVNQSGTILNIFAAQQTYAASGSGAYLNFKTQNVNLFGPSLLTPADSISLTQSNSITDADLPTFSSDALTLNSLNGHVILNGGSDIPATTALNVTSAGSYVTLGAQSAMNPLSLTANAGTAVNIDQSITTTNGQSYNSTGNVNTIINIPDSSLTLTDSSSAGILLNAPVVPGGGSSALTLNEFGSAPVTLGGNVGSIASPLTALTVNSSSGGIAIGGSTIATTGAQNYTGDVTLTHSTSLAASTGSVTFNNAVATGNNNNLTVTAGNIFLTGGSVTGTGNQTYNGTVNINTATTLSGTSILLNGTLTSSNASNLNVTTTGGLEFEAGTPQFISGGLGTLTADAAGVITLDGSLAANTLSLTSSAGAAGAISVPISATSPFYLAADNQSYATTGSSGTISLSGTYARFTGYPAVLNSLDLTFTNSLPRNFTITQASAIADADLPTVNQFVTVATSIFFPGSPSISSALTLNQMPYSINYAGAVSTSTPVISLTGLNSGQSDLTGADLSLSAPNSAISLGTSGQSLNLGSLSVNGIVNIFGDIVTSGTSTNSQSYTGTLILNGGPVLLDNSGTGIVSINSQITPGTSSDLTINATGGGAIKLLNAVGSTSSPLGSLTVNATNGSTLDILGGGVVTSEGQTYSGNLSLGADTLLKDTGSSGSTGINISGPVSGSSFNLTIQEQSASVPINLGSSGNMLAIRQLTVQTPGAAGDIDLNGGEIDTTGGQSYTGILKVQTPTILADSSGALSLPDITGPSTLSVNAPTDTVTLTQSINPAAFNATAADILLPAGNAISTSLGQVLTGRISLSGNTNLSDTGAAGSSGIQLLGSLAAPTDSLTLNQAGGASGVIGNGTSSEFNLGNLTITQGNFYSQLGTLILNNPIQNSGDLTLRDSLFYTNDSGTLTLGGKFDLLNGSTLTVEPSAGPFAADVVSNATVGSISDLGGVTIEGDNVTVNGSIRATGQVLLQSDNQLAIGPFGITNADFRPTALLTLNTNISGGNVLLNPDSPVVPGLGAEVPDAATIVSPTGATVNVTGSTVAMGREQKWTSLGSLTITGPSSSSTVSLGDLNVLNNLIVTAPTINMLTRGFGSLLTPQGLHANSATKPDGVDAVAGNIHFSTMPIPLPAAAPGGPPYPQFATPTGGGTVPGYTIHVFGLGTGGLTAADLYSTVLSPGITASQKYYLDLQASGPVTTNVFDSFIVFTVPQIPQVKTNVTLSSSQRAVLRSAGINARNPSLPSLLALSDGRAVFNDIPRSDGLILENPSLIDYYITTARLPYHRTLAFIALYKRVFLAPVINPHTGKPVLSKTGLPEYRSLRNNIRLQLRQAWDRYSAVVKKTHGTATAAGFRGYLLHTPAEAAAAKDVRNLSGLIQQAYQLGLSPKALRLSAGTILAELSPEALSTRRFERVVLGRRFNLIAPRSIR